MTTPTRAQIEAEFASFIEYPSEDKRYVTTASCLLFAEHIARIAHTAGRAQGLMEAKEAVQALHAKVADPIFGQERHDVGHAVLDNCAAAIERLIEKDKPEDN